MIHNLTWFLDLSTTAVESPTDVPGMPTYILKHQTHNQYAPRSLLHFIGLKRAPDKAEMHNIRLEALGVAGSRLGSRHGSMLNGLREAIQGIDDSALVAVHLRGLAYDQ